MLSAVQAAASHTNKVKNKVFPGRAAPAQTLPPGGGMGKPGFPISLREGRARPDPPAGGGCGETRFPHGHVRRSCAWRTPPNDHDLGARAARPRHGAADTVPAPALTLPPLGAGTRRLPPAGGGWEGGRTLRTMVTSAVHAAPLRTDGMHILPGRAAPSQTLPGAGAWVRGPPARVR